MSDAGKVIGQALEIVKKTYKEVNRLKEDAAQLLLEVDSSYQFSEEYSYGPKSLYLKTYHVYLFRNSSSSEEEDGSSKDSVFAIAVIFLDEGKRVRISLQDEPEIWFATLELKNSKERIRPWYIMDCLTVDDRSFFEGGALQLGGTINGYKAPDEDEPEAEWRGQFIGYPLVYITDRNDLEEKVIKKLFA